MPDRSGKRSRDVNELAKQLVDEATGEASKFDPEEGKDPGLSQSLRYILFLSR